MNDRLTRRELVGYAWSLQHESGREVPPLDADALAAVPDDDLDALLRSLDEAPVRGDWPYREPSAEAEVLAALPAAAPPVVPGADLADRVAGAWLGRVAGNMLGKPVEVGWSRARLDEYLRVSGSLDADGLLADWVVADAALAGAHALEASWPATTRGRVSGSVRDDDVDYTVLALGLLEEHGLGMTAVDVADAWLRTLPYLQVFTAERAAYANLVAGLEPPATAVVDNPFGEWIGALIRADAYGLALPGRPREAARAALRDASVSHVANGLYGATWVASLVANAVVATSADEALARSLAEVPPGTRLHEVLERTIALHAEGAGWADALGRLDAELGLAALHHVHVLNNAAVIAAALLWGDGDPVRTVGLAVQGGLDTDSTAATAGCVVGALRGRDALPGRWRDELGDVVRTGLFGVGETSLTALADRTLAVARRLAGDGAV